ncbi:MAG: hypothetical protein R2828_03740 [Saprospiraceae bacterium]
MQLRTLPEYFEQFRTTVQSLVKAIPFIRENKLWKGLMDYGWVMRGLLIVGGILGLKFFSVVMGWMGKARVDNPIAALSSMGVLAKDVIHEGYGLLFSSSSKYIVLVLLEIVIFHFARRTLEILSKKPSHCTFKDFVQAQVRMIKIAFVSWIMENIATNMISFAFGLFDPIGVLEPTLIFAVQCFFLGFAILDNYHEQFEMSIKESLAFSKGYIGVALAAGIFLYLAMLIPGIGSVVGTLIAAVGVSIAMFKLSDLHLLEKDLEMKLDDLV